VNIEQLYQVYLENPTIQTDTRKLQPGGIFFALSGANFNGNSFAAQALEQGAAYVVVDDPSVAKDDRYIVVSNTLETLQKLANHHRRQFDIPFIAVTGSNGKTTTKELLAAVLGTQYKTYATEGNLNNHIGVPLTLLKIQDDAEMAIIEMGANHQKEIESYCKIAEPTHGLITNCGKAHIEGFGGEEGVRKGKGELFDFLRAQDGCIFRNSDLPYLEDMAKGIRRQVTYGSGNAQYIGKPIMNGVFLQVAVLSANKETLIDTQLVGSYNFANVMAAVAVGSHFQLSMNGIKKAIAKYMPDNSRSQLIQAGSNQVILDAYNANPTSMRAAILNFAGTNLPQKTLWIGGMKEMGSEEQREHNELVALIASHPWKDVILVGPEFELLHNGYKWFKTSAEAAEFIKAHTPTHSSILVKGSRGSKMEVMVDVLKAG
jgi:UDP-N-acetylmuramoyl-tripeptide--D-alanyl-D-alanine ligase